MNKADLIYFAGLFDGDGCVRIAGSPSHGSEAVMVSITNMDKPVLDAAQALWGGRVRQIDKKTQRVWRWDLGKGHEVFLEHVLPYARVKRRQIELALQWRAERPRSPERLRLREEISALKRTHYLGQR